MKAKVKFDAGVTDCWIITYKDDNGNNNVVTLTADNPNDSAEAIDEAAEFLGVSTNTIDLED